MSALLRRKTAARAMSSVLIVIAGLSACSTACGDQGARQVTGPPGDTTSAGPVLFSSDFRTARGNSTEAVSDGGKWDFVSRGSETTMEIMRSTGLDFPTENVYRVIATREMEGWSMLRKTGMPIPAVGESRYYRWYIRVTMPDNLDDYNTHPIQDGVASSQTNWQFNVINSHPAVPGVPAVAAGHWQPQFWATTSPYPYQRWYGPDLNKNQTYRMEVHVLRVSASSFQMHVRVYDSSNRLIADDDDFQKYDNPPGTLASNPTFPFTNVNTLDGLNAGNNGIAGNAPFPFTLSYQAAFAVCTSNWCGAYNGTY